MIFRKSFDGFYDFLNQIKKNQFLEPTYTKNGINCGIFYPQEPRYKITTETWKTQRKTLY